MIESTLESAAALVLLAAWRALPLLAVALAVDLGLGRRVVARHQAWLWTLVAVRLLLPFSVAAPLSLHGPIDDWTVGRLEPESTPSAGPTNPELRLQATDLHPAHAPLSAEEIQAFVPPAAADVTPETAIIWTVIVLWLLVAVAALLRVCVAHLRFALRLRDCRELTEAALVDLVARECDDLRIRRRPRLKEVPGLATPAVFGLLRATICLPPGLLGRLEPPALRWVLRHELAHVRRFDAWTLSLAAIMRAVHWFNPCAWLVVSKLRTRAEQAADELALRGASTADVVAYGRLLLEFAEAGEPSRAAPALGFVPFITGRGLRRRIERITRPIPQPGRPLRRLLAAAFLLVAVAGLTDAEQPQAPEPKIRTAEIDRIDPVSPPTADEAPASVRSYDVAALLAKLREREPDADVELGLIRFARSSTRMPEITEGRLTVEATEERHRGLTEQLDAMARSGPQQIAIQLRILQVDLAAATPIEWRAPSIAGQGRTSGAGPMLIAQIVETQLGALVRAAEQNPLGNMLMAPRVTTFNGQTVTVTNRTQRPFATGVVPADNGRWRPRVETFDDGLKTTMRSVATETGTIELSIDLENSEIGAVRLVNLPVSVAGGPRGDKPMVTLQMPTVRSDSLRMTVELAEGESLLIAAPRSFDPRGGKEAAEASNTTLLYAFTPRKIAGTDRLE